MKKLFLILSVGLLCLCATGTASANLITNGSFEFGTHSGNSYDTLTAGTANDSAIVGWTVDDGSIDWIGSYWTASDGTKSIDLAGFTNGLIIGQQFATVIGKTYTVEFDMAGNPDQDYEKALISAVLGGVFYDFSFSQAGNTHANMGWATHSFNFVATDEWTNLSFGNLSDREIYLDESDAWGAALDNVSVVAAPVPEPATMMLFGIGLLGLAGVSRRKK